MTLTGGEAIDLLPRLRGMTADPARRTELLERFALGTRDVPASDDSNATTDIGVPTLDRRQPRRHSGVMTSPCKTS